MKQNLIMQSPNYFKSKREYQQNITGPNIKK